MTETPERCAARLTHLRKDCLVKGEPVPLPLTPAAMYHLPGDPGLAGEFNVYGRTSNPTWEGLEERLTLLEGAPALAFPSGMAAISALMFALLKPGDRVLLPADGYYVTRAMADRFLKPLGIEIQTRPTADFAEGGFDGCRLVLIETPSNPGLDVCDIAAIVDAAHTAGALVAADNTTMTPLGQNVIGLGVDAVVAADTKAPNGHSDVVFGHVASNNAEIMEAVREWRNLTGPVPGPFEAWLVHRGLDTLEVRLSRMWDTAEALAPRLADHPAIHAIRYPGLPTDPAFETARKQMRRKGFLIGMTLENEDLANRFIEQCDLIQPATSFGGVHTSAERRARWGDAVAPGFVRLSVGCEPLEELWQALSTALDELPA